MKTPIQQLRIIGMVEAVSFVALLGIAMPLKYMAGMPIAVKLVGWMHGVLFLLVCLAIMKAKDAHDWSLTTAAKPLIAALVPFGPFAIDAWLRRQDTPPPSRA